MFKRLSLLSLLVLVACERNDPDQVDADGDGFVAAEDCRDNDPSSFPGAEELCDSVDNDCDGEVDNGVLLTWFTDADADGFGGPIEVQGCQMPASGAPEFNDCDDFNNRVNPEALEICDGVDNDCDDLVDDADLIDESSGEIWYADADSDGYGDALSPLRACSQPEGSVRDSSDCDDAQALSFPLATEVCDSVDNDCDGEVDEPDAADAVSWYADADADGFGDAAIGEVACSAPAGFGADDTDCDDAAAAVNPAAVEVCDSIDNDCSGDVDSDAVDQSTWYLDRDSDGYGDVDTVQMACEQPELYVVDATDCEDVNASVFPGATEVCDTIDNDCDGAIDPSTSVDASTWYADLDSDGYGNASSSTVSCEAPSGNVTDNTDCDDSDAAVSPAGTEVCDSVDNDCDGSIDPDTSSDASTWYADVDGDGYGDPDTASVSCSAPSGSVLDDSDCDDSDAEIEPGASEICDGVDNDCDASTSEAGMVSFTPDSSGVMTNASLGFAGTYSAPEVRTLSTDGTYTFCEGTHFVDLTISADVTLVGATGDPADVVLDGAVTNTVLEVDTAGVTLSVQDLSIDNGYADTIWRASAWGSSNGPGGISCMVASTVALDNVSMQNNAGYYGGAVGLRGCDLTAVDTEISDNTALSGGAVAVWDGDVDIQDSVLSDNIASVDGGAVYSTAYSTSRVSLDLQDTEISGNTGDYGGGMRVNAASVTQVGGSISDNTASYGGGVYMSGTSYSCDGSSSTASITGNTASSGGGFNGGSNTLTVKQCDLGTGSDDNSSDDVYWWTTSYSSYGSSASFTCSGSSCY